MGYRLQRLTRQRRGKIVAARSYSSLGTGHTELRIKQSDGKRKDVDIQTSQFVRQYPKYFKDPNGFKPEVKQSIKGNELVYDYFPVKPRDPVAILIRPKRTRPKSRRNSRASFGRTSGNVRRSRL